MNKKIFTIIAVLFFFLQVEKVKAQENTRNWTHFRGSHLNGLADDKSYPVEWNDSTNIIWKTSIPGRGWSSPVVYGDQVWFTTASADGMEMSAVCIDFETGSIRNLIKLFEPDSIYSIHAVNSYATPTPCIENGFVYVHFGQYGTACINTSNGRIVWKRTDLYCEHVQGPGSSPIIHGNKLILHLEGTDVQYLVALDKRTGENLWKINRPVECYEPLLPIGKKAYTTPIVMNINGKELLISNGSAVCIAYNIETGEEVWRIIGGEDTSVSMPFTYKGNLYFYTSLINPKEGERYSELLAVNPNGSGDIGESNILWKMQAPILQLSTPVAKDGLIYTIDSKSNIFCLDAINGQVIWTNRMKGKFNSSPVAASGNIYFSSTQGITYVFKQGRTMGILAENKLDGEIWATPSFIEGSILLRTSNYLYKISRKD